MSLQEERMQVLRMLEQGKLTADEAAELLAAIETGARNEAEAVSKSQLSTRQARWLRIRVTDEATGKRKVNVNVPMAMVNVALKMGAKFAPDMNINEIIEAIKGGAEGKIVEVQDNEDGERVEIFME